MSDLVGNPEDRFSRDAAPVMQYKGNQEGKISEDLFFGVEALRPSKQFFSHVNTFFCVEPVLSNEDEVSCSRTQHRATGEIQTRDLVLKSLALYQLS